MEIKTIQLDPLTTEIQWTQDGRIVREQFCDRGSPGEVQKMVSERLRELRDGKDNEVPKGKYHRFHVLEVAR